MSPGIVTRFFQTVTRLFHNVTRLLGELTPSCANIMRQIIRCKMKPGRPRGRDQGLHSEVIKRLVTIK